MLSKNEVHCSFNITMSIDLVTRLCKNSVLETEERYTIESLLITISVDRKCLRTLPKVIPQVDVV